MKNNQKLSIEKLILTPSTEVITDANTNQVSGGLVGVDDLCGG